MHFPYQWVPFRRECIYQCLLDTRSTSCTVSRCLGFRPNWCCRTFQCTFVPKPLTKRHRLRSPGVQRTWPFLPIYCRSLISTEHRRRCFYIQSKFLLICIGVLMSIIAWVISPIWGMGGGCYHVKEPLRKFSTTFHDNSFTRKWRIGDACMGMLRCRISETIIGMLKWL